MLMKSAKMACLLILLLFLTTACAAPFLVAAVGLDVYALSGEEKNFTTKDSMTLDKPYPNILKTIEEVGKEMGYDISAIDRETNTISIAQNSSNLRMAIGSEYKRLLTVTVLNGGKKLSMTIALSGMRNDANQETASKILGDFKEKLSKKLTDKTQLGSTR